MKWLKRLLPGSVPGGTPPAAGGSAPPERMSGEDSGLEVDPRTLISGSSDASDQILDCREVYEWRSMRIPGSLHIPMAEIPARLSELPAAGELLVVCAHGVRSLMVAQYLQQQGFAARSLRGGLDYWQRLGGAIER